jgi:hypothetical protein
MRNWVVVGDRTRLVGRRIDASEFGTRLPEVGVSALGFKVHNFEGLKPILEVQSASVGFIKS